MHIRMQSEFDVRHPPCDLRQCGTYLILSRNSFWCLIQYCHRSLRDTSRRANVFYIRRRASRYVILSLFNNSYQCIVSTISSCLRRPLYWFEIHIVISIGMVPPHIYPFKRNDLERCHTGKCRSRGRRRGRAPLSWVSFRPEYLWPSIWVTMRGCSFVHKFTLKYTISHSDIPCIAHNTIPWHALGEDHTARVLLRL